MALKFSKGNAKLDTRIWNFSLPAGVTCPGAEDCRAMATLVGGKRRIKDFATTTFRCFAASDEVRYQNVFSARRHNLEEIKRILKTSNPAEIISSQLPTSVRYLRVHVSGDYFSQAYFDVWMDVARLRPQCLFYSYTKSLPFWVARLGKIPANFVLTASIGGKFDELIAKHGLKYARVVYSEAEAAGLSLPIDHDDTHAMRADAGNFALLLHGVQPKGSEAAKAAQSLPSGYNASRKGKITLPVLT